ncbi:MAG: leucyl/phenylalanyl-tRNA--protein transferase [Rhodospirillales bacterium]|nr:leucyl/phenylalanyl-tRNA--protein transferase [Rhodospirillales bacterium]MBO6786568.1 leucyl/phenylalanyl-tRNA--protein transferase [Rhodospirillales bacterium]
MSNRSSDDFELTPELLLRAYTVGVFPMAESRNATTISWIDPRNRGVLPLDRLHISKSLRKTVRRGPFEVSCNRDFATVIAECGRRTPDRGETWINPQIEQAVNELHRMGYAHSVEARLDGKLVGGLYGVALGGVFFGESMFSRATDASKVALVHLCARLRLGRFKLLDTQFVTDHLEKFGAIEIPAREFLKKLEAALSVHCLFPADIDQETLGSEFERMFSEQRED